MIEAARRWPDAPTPWIDLSTGINPVPYPLPDLPPEAWTRLPEPEDEAALIAAAAGAYGAAPENVVAAPGTSALIALLALIFPGPAAVLGPTYGEYAAAWPGAIEVTRLTELRARPVRVVCRPNNPDGRCDPVHDVLALASDGVLVVDEAFADFAVGPGVWTQAARPNSGLVVLKSFGKAYGLGGLRLGFALAAPDIAARLRHAVGPWPVSGPAIAIATRALADRDWRDGARARLQRDALRLDALLRAAGMTILGGTPLFRLAECDAAYWHDRLARRGILTRAFPAHERWLRFGIPCAWQRVERALLV